MVKLKLRPKGQDTLLRGLKAVGCCGPLPEGFSRLRQAPMRASIHFLPGFSTKRYAARAVAMTKA